MKIFIRLAIGLFICSILTIGWAVLTGRMQIGFSIGYQVDGFPCTIQFIDTSRPSQSYTVINEQPFCLQYAAWSPNHQYAALVNYSNGLLRIASGRDGSGWQQVFDIEGVFATQGSLAWSYDSRQLIFLTEREDVTVLGSVRMENDVPDKPRFFTVPSTQPIAYSQPAWSPDGQFVAFGAYDAPRGQGGEELYILNVITGAVQRVTANTYRDESPSWSPDGTQLVFASSKTGYNELYTINLVTHERQQLTYSTIGYSPNWSPDGQSIVFASNMNYGYDLYVIGSNGFGLHRLTFKHSPVALYPVWLVGSP